MVLQLVTAGLAFTAQFAGVPTRASVVMATSLESPNYVRSGVLGASTFTADPVNVEPKNFKGIKSFESKFAYAHINDSSVGPPCGICHHQVSAAFPFSLAHTCFKVLPASFALHSLTREPARA